MISRVSGRGLPFVSGKATILSGGQVLFAARLEQLLFPQVRDT